MTWWMVLLLIFGILFLIGCIPVGVDAAYLGGSFTLKVKIWLLRLQILPAKPKKPKMEKASAAKDGQKPAGGKDKAPAAKEAQTADGAEKRIAPELPVESGKRVEPAGCARERAGA